MSSLFGDIISFSCGASHPLTGDWRWQTRNPDSTAAYYRKLGTSLPNDKIPTIVVRKTTTKGRLSLNLQLTYHVAQLQGDGLTVYHLVQADTTVRLPDTMNGLENHLANAWTALARLTCNEGILQTDGFSNLTARTNIISDTILGFMG